MELSVQAKLPDIRSLCDFSKTAVCSPLCPLPNHQALSFCPFDRSNPSIVLKPKMVCPLLSKGWIYITLSYVFSGFRLLLYLRVL
jgi:hypothetical protein